jgi:hypothetical protein
MVVPRRLASATVRRGRAASRGRWRGSQGWCSRGGGGLGGGEVAGAVPGQVASPAAPKERSFIVRQPEILCAATTTPPWRRPPR